MHWANCAFLSGTVPCNATYLPTYLPVQWPELPELTPETCDTLTKAVYSGAVRDLQTDINLSTRLEPLENETPKAITAVLRHYIVLVVSAKH
jgi:hypothetical protein